MRKSRQMDHYKTWVYDALAWWSKWGGRWLLSSAGCWITNPHKARVLISLGKADHVIFSTGFDRNAVTFAWTQERANNFWFFTFYWRPGFLCSSFPKIKKKNYTGPCLLKSTIYFGILNATSLTVFMPGI